MKMSRFFSTHCKPKTAIMMMNMGGPKNLADVKPFLHRLFSDKEIINLPFQKYLARFILQRRVPKIVQQYKEIGGGSPIHDWTRIQGEELVKILDKISPETGPHKFFIGFRYVQPLTEETIVEIENEYFERAVAFSQYPQYSCTTSGSSYNALARHYVNPLLKGDAEIDNLQPVPSKSPGPVWSFLDRWSTETNLVKAFAQLIREAVNRIEDPEDRKSAVILFSAHSLPIEVVDRGDPYIHEVAATVMAVMQELKFTLPYRLVWQSKVGPKKWMGPSTEAAIKGFAKAGKRNLILVPIAFTSDHIETLYEMDFEYCQDVAKEAGNSVKGMANLLAEHLKSGQPASNQYFLRCPMCTNTRCIATRQFISAERPRLTSWTEKTFSPPTSLDS